MKNKNETTVESIREWLKNNKLKFNETDNDFILNCPLCTDTRNRFGIKKKANPKKKLEIGAWNCFNCNSNSKKFFTLGIALSQKLGKKFKTKDVIKKEDIDGDEEKASTLAKNFHEKYHKLALHKNEEGKHSYGVFDYLINERKLTEEAINHFQLGARRSFESKKGKKNLGDHLVIPYLRDGNCVNVKYRSINPETPKDFKWRRETGGMTWLFNDEAIDNLDYDEIIISEAEIDAMSIWCMGFENVVGLTAGAKGFKQAWYERLLRFKKIYLVLDNDGAGQEGARQLARRLGLGRCYNVVFPEGIKDANDFIKKHSPDEFSALLEKAVQFDVQEAKSLTNIMRDIFQKRFLQNNEDVKGWEFPWKSVQEKTGSMKAGHLVILAARPKVGKSTLAIDLTRRLAKRGVRTGMYSCEMNLDTIGEKMVMQVSPDVQHIDDITQEQIMYASHVLPKKNMYFYQPKTPDDLKLEKVCEVIEEMVNRYGLKIFVFDNLHFLCRDEDEYTAVGKATQAFKLLGEKLRIPIILITHPRKGDNNKRLTPDDLKGSSSIFQDADLIILMNREKVDTDDMTDEEQELFSGNLSPNVEIDVIGRWTQGGRTNLYFNEDRSLFKEEGADYEKMREFLDTRKKKR